MTIESGEIDQARLWRYMDAHPDSAPATLIVPRLVENPSVCASTARWQRFLGQVRDYAARWPDDPDWPRFVACVEAGLAYRETVPPEYRLWDFGARGRSAESDGGAPVRPR